MQIIKGTSSSKPQTIQKQTYLLAAASWVLPERRVRDNISMNKRRAEKHQEQTTTTKHKPQSVPECREGWQRTVT